MPGHCCVPLCRANYPDGPKARVFSFPRDTERRNKWLRAIPRKDYTPTKFSKVCERHFEEQFFLHTLRYEDFTTGKVIEVRRSVSRLTDDAVPTIFPECPSYLSTHLTSREGPEEKRSRREFEDLQRAMKNSVQTFEEERVIKNSAQTFEETRVIKNSAQTFEEKRVIKNPVQTFEQTFVSTFSDLLVAIELTEMSDFWTVVRGKEFVMFLNLSQHDVPTLQHSVTIKLDLSITVAFKGTKVIKLPGLTIPESLSNMYELTGLLEHVEKHATGATQRCSQFEAIMALIVSLLEDLCRNESADRQASLTFLKDQVSLLLKKSSRYSADNLAFCALLYAISPHAYNLVRSSAISLPHRTTVYHLCSVHKEIPTAELQDHNFLSQMKSRVNSMEERDKIVALVMNDIHIEPYYSCIDGTMGETSISPPEPAKTAHVFMVHSLLSPNKDVVHILLSSDITAELLHYFLKKLIVRLEEIGLRIICITTGNNSTSKEAVAMFRQPEKLDIVYPHPADPSRPLFFVIDSVHLLKCVIIDWINQKDQELSIVFPEFEGSECCVSAASLETLRKLCLFDENSLIRFPCSIKKALYPTAIGVQNANAALKVFNKSVIEALKAHEEDLECASETANFIGILTKWQNIVSAKMLSKRRQLQGLSQYHISSMDDPQLEYLSSMVDWLDRWEALRLSEGTLTRETHAALRLTCYSLIELCRYCFEELKCPYVLIGKFQTKSLLCHD